MRAARRRGAALALLMLAGPALAGRSCEDKPLSPQQIERGMNLAQATVRQLEAGGAQVVVVLARAGQDLSKYGLQWSHLGFAYREQDQGSGKPVWRVLHKLNHCGSAQGALYRHGLGDFFLDRPHRYDAAYVTLTPELQAALLPLLRDNRQAGALHEPRYNMLSYPWAQTYQQSNQWVLEMLASAAAPELKGRAEAQAWLKAKGYRPSQLQLSTATRLGARMGMANIAFDDHPMAKRMAGQIETIGADSLFNWLPRAGLSQGLELVKQ